ncbi:hypothetical protein AGMMS49574_02090 [Bacteroidia bacterium]|nr:hypothetical protein AGMMS49574_02090 [Bacteroidia bacterium]GHU59780.1 hypothetical protein FACS189411_16960 [Bacteroidia bacterium]
MEKISSQKESLLIEALKKEVQALKNGMETNSLKEQIIAHILQTQDKAKLVKIAETVRNILNPVRERDIEPESTAQGNG